ncbi:acyltransferase family protein [Asticcacaulis sp.]|uniref:acyltransferase family protein n=1 Tax=Asticcacaulis sp. TaxID=1872648 RepID=UPI00391AF7D2
MSAEYRVQWVDAAKGIGIFLVVFGHVWRGLEAAGIIEKDATFVSIDNAIYLFHMPLFFVLSGMFFEKGVLRDGIQRSFLKRVETLLYPLVVWSYISAIFLYAASGLTNRGGLSISDILLYPFPPKDIYWFLAALFIVQSLASIFAFMNFSGKYWIGLIIASLFVLFLKTEAWPFWIQGTIDNAPLFFVGLIISRWRPTKSQAWLGLGIFLAAELWAITRSVVLDAPGDFFPGAAATVGLIAFFSQALCAQNVFVRCAAFAGRASMTVYVSHIICMAGVRIALMKLGVEDVAIHVVIGSVGGFFLPLVLHQMLNRTGMLRLLGLGRQKAMLISAAAQDISR